MNTGDDDGSGAAADPPVFECLLEKRGSWIKNWKARFFVLDGATLRYYGKRGDATPKGTFGVVTYVDLPDRGGRKRDNRVDIIGAGGTRLCVAARDPAVKAALLERLGAAVWRADPAAAVAARKAAAPDEVRTVLDGGLVAIYLRPEHKRVSRVVAEWLVGAHAAAHDDPATKRLARLVLGVSDFTTDMEWAGVFDDPYKSGLRQRLQALGAPLAEAFVRDGLRDQLGSNEMAEHAKKGGTFTLHVDIQGIVPLPTGAELGGGGGGRAAAQPGRAQDARRTSAPSHTY